MPANVLCYFLVTCGGMAEWSKAAVLKTVERKLRGFESYSLRHYKDIKARRAAARGIKAKPRPGPAAER